MYLYMIYIVKFSSFLKFIKLSKIVEVFRFKIEKKLDIVMCMKKK